LGVGAEVKFFAFGWGGQEYLLATGIAVDGANDGEAEVGFALAGGLALEVDVYG